MKSENMNLIKKLRSGWTLLKYIRVGLGSLILYSSIQSGNAGGIVLGGLFTLLFLFSDGVCGFSGTCNTQENRNKSLNETIDYEELGVKK